MRSAVVLVTLLVALSGCAAFRQSGLQEAAPMVAAPVPPAPTSIDCVEHPRIDAWAERISTQRGLRRTVEVSLARGEPYLPAMRAILADLGLPEALAFLPVIESGFRVTARGRHGDVGLWQLRRPAARRFGLTITRRRDDRLHPEHATRAAARYLDFLYARYGDWPLALAAYNAGEGRVDRAMASGLDTFWALADEGLLPQTSCEYVPRFLALVRLLQRERTCTPAQT